MLSKEEAKGEKYTEITIYVCFAESYVDRALDYGINKTKKMKCSRYSKIR